MKSQSLLVADIADFLQNELQTDRYPANEQGGIFHASERAITRLGLALEPWSGLPEWVAEHQLDALWLHRPWQVNLAELPPDVGIVSHHSPFDETLGMGYNTRMAAQVGVVNELESLGTKQDVNEANEKLPLRPIGMLFDTVEREFDGLLQSVQGMFGGYDRAEAGSYLDENHTAMNRVAVVGSMNDTLIREAADRGANVYVTGQYRKVAQVAVDQTGIAVIAIGHRRSELWGLRVLGDLLHKQWQHLEIVVRDDT